MPALNVAPVLLSHERPAVRWTILGCVWLLVIALGVFDSFAVRDYVALLDDSGALAADSLPLHRPLPAPYADAQTWTRLALAADTSGVWQVRHTDIDNAPVGRDVHWNSAFVHLIAIAGRLRASNTGEAVPLATERALAWINLPILIAVIVFFSAWIAQRMGAGAGALMALGMLGHRWFYDGFAPNNVDHHGLLTAATFGCVLGAMFMSPAWTSDPRSARSAAILSSVCGALGLWVSAASVVPTIALVGAAAACASWLGASGDASLWRLWSRVGATVSFLAYLLEYAPSHIGMRLEVNHPLYALAWLGGGELVASIVERHGGNVTPARWRVRVRVLAALALVAAPLVVIVIGGSRVFLPGDAALARLHSHIDEFTSLAGLTRRLGISYLGRYAMGFAMLLPALLAWHRGPSRARLLFVSVVAGGLTLLGCWQVRWWLPASGAQLCVLLAGLATLAGTWSPRARWLVVAAAGALFVEQSVARTAITRRNVAESAVTPMDAMQPLSRDVAVALRRSQPTGMIRLLSSPDQASAISYFGGFESIGTFYWENRDGLAAAAAMLDAPTDDDALAKIRERGVTHVVLTSSDNFLDEYLAFLRPAATSDERHQTFGWRVLFDGDVPRWLRAIPFAPRPGSPSKRVLLFQVAPDQSERDAQLARGIALAATGDDSAAIVVQRAIALAPADQRAGLLADAARETYRWRAHRASLVLFEASLSLAPAPTTLLATAWLLATSPDDAVRDGRRAVTLVEPLARSAPGAGGVLDTYAAALAESGRFDDAVRAESAAIDNAQKNGDAAGAARGMDRLRSYRAGRPWRQ